MAPLRIYLTGWVLILRASWAALRWGWPGLAHVLLFALVAGAGVLAGVVIERARVGEIKQEIGQ